MYYSTVLCARMVSPFSVSFFKICVYADWSLFSSFFLYLCYDYVFVLHESFVCLVECMMILCIMYQIVFYWLYHVHDFVYLFMFYCFCQQFKFDWYLFSVSTSNSINFCVFCNENYFIVDWKVDAKHKTILTTAPRPQGTHFV